MRQWCLRALRKRWPPQALAGKPVLRRKKRNRRPDPKRRSIMEVTRHMRSSLSQFTHLPALAHPPHPWQPMMGAFPIQKKAVWIPSASKLFPTSKRALWVHPLSWGLPLSSKTFMFLPPVSFFSLSVYPPRPSLATAVFSDRIRLKSGCKKGKQVELSLYNAMPRQEAGARRWTCPLLNIICCRQCWQGRDNRS